MSKEKQIEGIIEAMGGSCASCFGHGDAEVIYNAGYRKQSETDMRIEIANAIFDDIEASIAVHAFTSKSEDYADGAADTIEWVDSKIEELRKKYIGDQV